MTMMILELTYNSNLRFWQTKWQKIVTFLALQDVKHKNIKMMNVLRSWKNWSGIYTKFNPKNWLSSFFFINLFFCVSCIMALSKTILKWNVYIYRQRKICAVWAYTKNIFNIFGHIIASNQTSLVLILSFSN